MDIKAFKMDGLGNDFVIIDNREKITNLTKDQIIKICDRKFIGCDQLILIKKNDTSDATLEFFNSDGGTSGACGNGTRCIADLLARESNKKTIILTTLSGNLKSEIFDEKIVSTEIGIAKTNWNEIPLSKNIDTKNLNIKISGSVSFNANIYDLNGKLLKSEKNNTSIQIQDLTNGLYIIEIVDLESNNKIIKKIIKE